MKILGVLLSVFLIADGIYALTKKRFIGSKEDLKRKKYVEAAYNKFVRMCGVVYIISGLVILAGTIIRAYLYSGRIISFVEMGIIIALLIVLLIASRRIPKKNSTEETGESEKADKDVYIDED